MIMTTKKNKPKFNVLNLGFFKSVKARWRKPRGTHNRKRMKQKWTGASPHIGYRNPIALRGMHPGGLREVLVHNIAELEVLKNVVVRIATGVGAKKKTVLEAKAKAMNLRVLNAEAKTVSKHVSKEPAKGPHPMPVAGQKPAAAKKTEPHVHAAGPAGKSAIPAQSVKPAAPAQKPQARKAAPPRAPEPPQGPAIKE
jgi:large subunit ribosomal protein L32e